MRDSSGGGGGESVQFYMPFIINIMVTDMEVLSYTSQILNR